MTLLQSLGFFLGLIAGVVLGNLLFDYARNWYLERKYKYDYPGDALPRPEQIESILDALDDVRTPGEEGLPMTKTLKDYLDSLDLMGNEGVYDYSVVEDVSPGSVIKKADKFFEEESRQGRTFNKEFDIWVPYADGEAPNGGHYSDTPGGCGHASCKKFYDDCEDEIAKITAELQAELDNRIMDIYTTYEAQMLDREHEEEE